jgi:hypothetical protein
VCSCLEALLHANSQTSRGGFFGLLGFLVFWFFFPPFLSLFFFWFWVCVCWAFSHIPHDFDDACDTVESGKVFVLSNFQAQRSLLVVGWPPGWIYHWGQEDRGKGGLEGTYFVAVGWLANEAKEKPVWEETYSRNLLRFEVEVHAAAAMAREPLAVDFLGLGNSLVEKDRGGSQAGEADKATTLVKPIASVPEKPVVGMSNLVTFSESEKFLERENSVSRLRQGDDIKSLAQNFSW